MGKKRKHKRQQKLYRSFAQLNQTDDKKKLENYFILIIVIIALISILLFYLGGGVCGYDWFPGRGYYDRFMNTSR
jgi:hypothetical protein